MNDEQKQAYDWAKNHDYPSVAARYARELATAVDNLQAQLAADRVKFAELQRYNVDCTKQFGMLQMDKVNLQNLLAESQRRERAAEALLSKIKVDWMNPEKWVGAISKWRSPQEAGKGEAE